MKRFILTVVGLGAWLLLGGFTASFASENITITVIHPGEMNIATYTTVAFGDIDGELGMAFADRLRATLVESGEVKVIDRKRFDEIMREQQLSQSDLMDENSRLKLGKVLSAAVVISGHYSGEYNEELYAIGKLYTREGKYTSTGNIEFTDLETGQIIKSKMIGNSSKDSESAYNTDPDNIDQKKLMRKCVDKDVANLHHAIAPWKEDFSLPFEKDKALPGLGKGIGILKMGQTEMAITEFANAAKAGEGDEKIKGKVLAKAYWNMGLAYLSIWDFDRASEFFTKAYSLDNDKKYVTTNENIKTLREERETLIQQGIIKVEQ